MRQSVPASFDEYLRLYSRFVLWAIRSISRGRARPDDIPDLVQLVHLRVFEKDYLTRCRTLIAERVAGQFSTYLYWLIRSVLVNEFRANVRNPLNRAYRLALFDLREPGERERKVARTVYVDAIPALQSRFKDLDFEERLLRDDTLDRFAQFIETTQRGAQLARTLQLMYEGHTTVEMTTICAVPKSRIVRARHDLREHFRAFTRRAS